MRLPALAFALAVFLTTEAGSSRVIAAPDTATQSIQAHAYIAARSSLMVSSEVLHFVVADPGRAATATVDFVAGIRTHEGAEVVLTVEAVRGSDNLVTFATDGEGGVHGAMASRPVLAGRWIGSGRRTGRIAFSLLGGAVGTYSVPVRFVLSAP